jgi:hypothetical protein
MDLGQGLQALAFFGFLAVVAWLRNRKDERESANRHEIYRKMLESPGGSADAVRAFMHQDEERVEQREIDNGRLGGMVATAVGVAFTMFLYGLRPERPVFLLGLLPLLVGVVLLINASVLAKRRRTRRSSPK